MEIKVKNFGDCPYCSESILENGLGVVSKCTQILHANCDYNDLDIEGDTGEYYCPNCGADLEPKLGKKLQEELERTKDVQINRTKTTK